MLPREDEAAVFAQRSASKPLSDGHQCNGERKGLLWRLVERFGGDRPRALWYVANHCLGKSMRGMQYN